AGRKTPRARVRRKVPLAGQEPAAAAGERDRVVVDGKSALFRRLATATDLGILAASAPHLPSSHTGSIVAPVGRPARARDLRPFRRREMGGGGSDVLRGRRQAGRVIHKNKIWHDFPTRAGYNTSSILAPGSADRSRNIRRVGHGEPSRLSQVNS